MGESKVERAVAAERELSSSKNRPALPGRLAEGTKAPTSHSLPFATSQLGAFCLRTTRSTTPASYPAPGQDDSGIFQRAIHSRCDRRS